MDVVVVLKQTRDGWVLFGIFSAIERAMQHVAEHSKKERFPVRYIHGEIGVIYDEKVPAAETRG